MTKDTRKYATSSLPDGFDMVPKPERNEKIYQAHIDLWFTSWFASHSFCGPQFVNWVKQVNGRADDSLKHLFYRYGIPASVILDRLALCKYSFLTREQLEAGDWIINVPDWHLTLARLDFSDSRRAKILRNKNLREKNAKILEKARRVLLDYPDYLVAVKTPNPLRLPEMLASIAQYMRNQKIKGSHRPRASAAYEVISDLTNLFNELTGNPLYEYAGRLAKTCFPEEWNPAGDIREAAKKLIKRKC